MMIFRKCEYCGTKRVNYSIIDWRHYDNTNKYICSTCLMKMKISGKKYYIIKKINVLSALKYRYKVILFGICFVTYVSFLVYMNL